MRAIAVSPLLFTAQALLAAGMLWGLLTNAPVAYAQTGCAEWFPPLSQSAALHPQTSPPVLRNIHAILTASCRKKALAAKLHHNNVRYAAAACARGSAQGMSALWVPCPAPLDCSRLAYPGFGFRALAPPRVQTHTTLRRPRFGTGIFM